MVHLLHLLLNFSPLQKAILCYQKPIFQPLRSSANNYSFPEASIVKYGTMNQ